MTRMADIRNTTLQPECETPRDDELLVTFLAERDINCPRCDYNLRGLTSDRCPECGESLKLNIGLVRPKLKAMIAGLIGLAAGAGLSGLLLIYAALVIAFRSHTDFFDTFIITNGTGFALLGGAMAAWLFMWHRLYQLSTTARTLLAILAWMLTFTYLLVFTYMIR